MNLGIRDMLELGYWDNEGDCLTGDLSTLEPGLTCLDSWASCVLLGEVVGRERPVTQYLAGTSSRQAYVRWKVCSFISHLILAKTCYLFFILGYGFLHIGF